MTKAKIDPSTTPTISGIAREHRVGRDTVRRWKDEGLDLANADAVQARVDAMANRSTSPDIAGARLAKIQAQTERIRFAHEVEKGRFVDAAIVHADGVRIGGIVRSSIDRLVNELPPQLAGRDAADIKKILSRVFRETLTNLSQYQSPIKFDQ